MLARPDDSDLDRGPKGTATERMCVVTREVKPVGELIRFVAAPDGTIVPDVKRKLPGRGIWTTADRETVHQAVRRNLFAKILKSDVRTDESLVDLTERLLERAALDALSIAGKASQALTGFTRVEAALERDDVIAVLHARDGAPDGIRKLGSMLRRRIEETAESIATIAAFTTSQLDLALGRPNVVHAALLAGDAGSGFLARYVRLERFRTGKTGNPGQDRTRHQDAQGLGTE